MKAGVPKWLVVITLVSIVCLAAIYLSAPPPPPKVALVFAPAWLSDGTNTLIGVGLTNFGTTRVSFNDQMWQAIVETPSGWITNRAPFASVAGSWVNPGERQGFTVHLPIDATRWQISARYHHYRRRDVHHDAWALIDKTGFWEHAPEFASSAASWCLNLLWRDTEGEAVVATQFFTNLPPVQPWPPK